MIPDERIEALEKRVDELEMTLRLAVAAAEESNRLDRMTDDLRGTPPPLPAKLSREDAVFAVGAMLRPLLAAVPPAKRAEAIAEGPPAHAVEAFASGLADASRETRDGLADIARHAREHAVTWEEIGVTAWEVVP